LRGTLAQAACVLVVALAACTVDVSSERQIEEDGRAVGLDGPTDGGLAEGDAGAPDDAVDAAQADGPATQDAAPASADGGPDTVDAGRDAEVILRDAESAPQDAAPAPPDAVPPDCPARLIVNEIDYDEPGPEDTEHIEILNAGCEPADLRDWAVRLINGDGQRESDFYYDVIALQRAGDFLNPGARLLVADQRVPNAPRVQRVELAAEPPSAIQNGRRDGVEVLFRMRDVVDAVIYEGTLAGEGEGEGAPGDPQDGLAQSIGRCPDGVDTDDNAADFRVMVSTPGLDNRCRD
jgi:hypothetical protein